MQCLPSNIGVLVYVCVFFMFCFVIWVLNMHPRQHCCIKYIDDGRILLFLKQFILVRPLFSRDLPSISFSNHQQLRPLSFPSCLPKKHATSTSKIKDPLFHFNVAFIMHHNIQISNLNYPQPATLIRLRF